MNENGKTITFVVIAAAVLLVAWVSRPGQWVGNPSKAVGEKLTPDFDPLTAASLDIVEYDEATATVHPFQVALVDFKGKRRWSIPSHSDYPADADRQVSGAATALMGLQILSVEGDTPAEHEKFGVIDPDAKTLKPGASGVGMRVTMRDKGGKELLSLIIGKEVPGRPGLRYVRRAGQDPIYTAAVSTTNLSTNFDRWIEKNVLKMNTWDLHRLWLRDYSSGLSMDERGRVGVERENRGEVVLEYSDQDNPHWKLIEDRKVNRDGTLSPNKMEPDEELNIAKIDELKNALDDLKIVDVARKPEGISADLKASADFMNKKEAILTLASRGFIVAMSPETRAMEICSKEGEVRCLMKDGVQYVLRFGDVALDGDSGRAKQDEKDKEQKEGQEKAENDAKKSSAGRNRYLFVMAEFNPDLVPKPKLEAVPEPKVEAENEPASGEGKKPAETAEGAQPGAEQTAASKPAAKPEATAADAKAPAKAEEKAADATATAKAEEKPDQGKEGPGDAKGEKSETGEKPADKAAAAKAERERIEKENKRKEDEYQEKLAAGKKHADELNARFADWYYIISDDVYRKIHLGRDEIIKKKEKKDGQAESKSGDVVPALPKNPVNQFDDLEKTGPRGK